LTDTPIRDSLDPDRLAPEASNPAVAEVMRDEVVFCLPSTPIDAVAKLLADNDLAEIPVLVDRRPVGYVRAEDILDRLALGEVVISGSDFAMRPPSTEIQVRHVLRTPALLVDEKQRLFEVIEVMSRQERTVALVMHDDETPMGMITTTEVAAALLRRVAEAGVSG
jgi:predicted transcriptional regulator